MLLCKWAVRGTANDLSVFGATAGAAFLSAHRVGEDEDSSGVARIFTHPLTLAGGIALTVLSSAVYRRLHREERFQGTLLGGIVAFGALVGHLMGMGLVDVVIRVLPWCVVLALLVTSCVSRAKQYN